MSNLAQKHFNFDDEDVKIKKPSGHKASLDETQEFHFKDEDDVVTAKKPSKKRKALLLSAPPLLSELPSEKSSVFLPAHLQRERWLLS